MFDLSWIELGFVAALALLVIGPKDLPKMFKMINQFVTKAKRTINDVKGGFKQLENEIRIVEGTTTESTNWKQLLPEDIRNLPDDFIPGSQNAEYHNNRAQQIANKKAEVEKSQNVQLEQPAASTKQEQIQ
ncbi:twin-arginine translocase TatA/TatE family subunit [Aliiglaciecola sp. SL4]|uniref:Sec-independent protein translocase subunit TatA/TatB n=1 Tax=Aliiglaciecola sp. SL4 TaxID=3239806 RepID=UPI00355B25EE